MPNWNEQIIEEFRANEGRVGGPFEGRTLLLLHHLGAKSGVERVNPLAYQRVGSGFAVFGSKGGALTNPDWFYNVQAHPQVRVEVGAETFDATARVVTGDERTKIWEHQKREFPAFAAYEGQTGGRQIPVVLLEPVAS